jgi:hypothetical protein
MSAIAYKETESASSSRTCQILILCEDFAAYQRAADVCWRILVQLADDLDFSFNCWKFYELADPDCAPSVLRSGKNSDIILLALHQPDLPHIAEEWLEALAGHRVHPQGVLALVLNEPAGSAAAVSRLAERMEHSARKLGMDFLSLVPTPRQEAEGFLTPLPATHGNFGERNHDHWGLNE